MASASCQRGFSLVEALVATAVVATAFGALTHLVVMATRANAGAMATTLATLLAAERADALSCDLSVAGVGTATLSPADALEANAVGFSDFFDARGQPLAAGPPAPPSAAYVRRWAVQALPGGPPGARLLHVVVLAWPHAAPLVGSEARRAELARLVVVKAGQE